MPIRRTKTSLFACLTMVCLLALNTAHGAENSQSTIDRQIISDLVAEYAFRWDKKDAVGISELFAPDSTIDWVVGGKPQTEAVSGRSNILAYARKAYVERLSGKQSRHYFTNLVFDELEQEHAVTRHMVLVTHQLPEGGPQTVATGYYRIVWTKQQSSWLIAHRTLYLDR